MRSRRTAAASAVLAVAGVAAAPAAQASTTAFHTYTITRSSATYQTAGNNLLPGGGDDAIVDTALPFPVRLYGKRFYVAHISTNGNVQFGNAPSAAYSNESLPTPTLSGPSVAPYWDDLVIRPHSSSIPDGIYTKTKGRFGHRNFIISWRGVDFATGGTAVRIEVIFTENSSNIVTIYGDGNGASATVGVQKSGSGPATQYAYNSGRNNTILPGEKLTYVYH